MKLLKSIVLSLALPVALTCASQAEAQTQRGDACGNAGIPPQLFAAVVEAPAALDTGYNPPPGWNPHYGRLTRDDIHYVSGNYVHVRLTTDRCTYVSGVQMGTRVLTTTGQGGYGYWAQAAAPHPTDSAQYAHLVRVQFPPVGDGSTDQVTISVRRSFSAMPPVSYRFTVVRVASVEAPAVPLPIGIVRDEVFNMFGQSIAARFNGPGNSAVLGLGFLRLHYDPSSLSVNVTPSGIGFQVKFRLDAVCDLTFRVYGTFTLDPQLDIVWVNEPEVSPNGCELVQVIPAAGAVLREVLLEIVDWGEAALVTKIEEALSEVPDPNGIPIDDVTTDWDQLFVRVAGQEPSVRIRVPYDAFDMGRGPTVFPAGQAIALAASGVGMHDQAAGVPATTAAAGPNGLPLAGTTTWPNPRALGRSGPLPFPGQPVARLLARTVPSGPQPDFVTYAYSPGCAVPASSQGPLWLWFGVNDMAADAERLRADHIGTWGYQLRVYFGETGAACASTGPTPPQNQFD